jgi:hypothetical protein
MSDPVFDASKVQAHRTFLTDKQNAPQVVSRSADFSTSG